MVKRLSDPRKPVSRLSQSRALNQISCPIFGEATGEIDSLVSSLPSRKSLIMPDSLRSKMMAISCGPLFGGAKLYQDVSPLFQFASSANTKTVSSTYPPAETQSMSSNLWYSSFANLFPCHCTFSVTPGKGSSFLIRMSISPPVWTIHILPRQRAIPCPCATLFGQSRLLCPNRQALATQHKSQSQSFEM